MLEWTIKIGMLHTGKCLSSFPNAMKVPKNDSSHFCVVNLFLAVCKSLINHYPLFDMLMKPCSEAILWNAVN